MKYADILDIDEHFQAVENNTTACVHPYAIIAAAIKKKDTSGWEKLRRQHLESNLKFDLLIHRLLMGNESAAAVKTIKKVFPVHPYTVYLISVIAQVLSLQEQVFFDFLHNSGRGFLKFIREHPQNESDYFLTPDYLWDYFREKFEQSEKFASTAIIEMYEQFRSDLSRKGLPYLAVFKSILLLHIINQLSSSPHDLLSPSRDNLESMFLGTEWEGSVADILAFLVSHEYIRETAETLFVVSVSPARLSKIEDHKKALEREESFADWLATLPFPSASILWLHHTSSQESDKERYEILLHFFETFAEFYAAVLLSGFHNDKALYEQEIASGLQESLAKNRLRIDLSTFGTWINITAFLAKRARSLYNADKEARMKCEKR